MSGVSKSLLRSLNRSYISEPIKDENRILELFSKFLNGEYETINSVLESGENLNFKDSNGNTLIHAIIRNESPNISEEKKLSIIRKLLDKNVSINSMTNLNQNVLHIACQKGYINIIIYLLSNGCDQKLHDNNGNTPLHYLIDKFIDTCKQDDLYKPSNKEIKELNSNKTTKINEILKYLNMNILFELFEKRGDYTIIKDGENIIDVLGLFINHFTQISIPNIKILINNKITEAIKIYTDKFISIDDKLQQIQNIILNSSSEFKKLYEININDDTILWDEFIGNQKNKTTNNKTQLINQINNNSITLIKLIDDNITSIKKIENNYYNTILNYASSCYYLFQIYYDLIANTKIPLYEDDNNLFLEETYLLQQDENFNYINFDDEKYKCFYEVISSIINNKLTISSASEINVDDIKDLIDLIDTNKKKIFDIFFIKKSDDKNILFFKDNLQINLEKINTNKIYTKIMTTEKELLNTESDNNIYKIYQGFSIIPTNNKQLSDIIVFNQIISEEEEQQPSYKDKIVNFDIMSDKLQKLQIEKNNKTISKLKKEKKTSSHIIQTLFSDDMLKAEKLILYNNSIQTITNIKDEYISILESDNKNQNYVINFIQKMISKIFELEQNPSIQQILTLNQNLASDIEKTIILQIPKLLLNRINSFINDELSNQDLILPSFYLDIDNYPNMLNTILKCKEIYIYMINNLPIYQHIYNQTHSDNQIILNNENQIKLNEILCQKLNNIIQNELTLLDYQIIFQDVKKKISKIVEMKLIQFLCNKITDTIENTTNGTLYQIMLNIEKYIYNDELYDFNPNTKITEINIIQSLIKDIFVGANNDNFHNEFYDNVKKSINYIYDKYDKNYILISIFYSLAYFLSKHQIEIDIDNIITGFHKKEINKFINSTYSFDDLEKLINDNFNKPLVDLCNDYLDDAINYYRSLSANPANQQIIQQLNKNKTNFDRIFKAFYDNLILILKNIYNIKQNVKENFFDNSTFNRIIKPDYLPIKIPDSVSTQVLKIITKSFKNPKTFNSISDVFINLINLEKNKNEIYQLFLNEMWNLTISEINNLNKNQIENTCIFIETLQDAKIIDNFLINYFPDDTYIKNIFIKLSENLTYNSNIINMNTYYYDETNSVSFKWLPIKIIINNIISSYETIKSILELKNNEDKFRLYFQQFNLVYIKKITKILFSIIYNLIILEKYIDQIIITKEEEEEEEKINSYLEILSNKNYFPNDLTKLYNKSQKYYNKYLTTKREIKERNYRRLIEKFYNDTIKIFNDLETIIEKTNKYQSLYQLNKYNEFIDNYLTGNKKITMNNTMFNNYKYDILKNLPKNYIEFKSKYFDFNIKDIFNLEKISDINFLFKNYPVNLIVNTISYIQPHNFNIFYNSKDDIKMPNNKKYNFKKLSSNLLDYCAKNKISLLDSDDIDEFDKIDKLTDFKPDYKFALGYDINTTSINILEENNKYSKMFIEEERNKNQGGNILLDLKSIKKYTLLSDNKISENIDKYAKFYFEDNLTIDKINFSTFLITTNLSELVNLIIYLIYSIIKQNNELSDIFLTKMEIRELTLYNNMDNTTKKESIKLGIELEKYLPNDIENLKNIFETFDFIKSNSKIKSNYILEIIKIFIKTITEMKINEQIEKIIEELKISLIENIKMYSSVSDTIIPTKITSIKISDLYKPTTIIDIINSSEIKKILENNKILTLIKKKSVNIQSSKIYNDKCVNIRRTEDLLGIELNYKILDINGNTIINRLIDQYNIFGLEKVLKLKPFLKTYKNNNNITPQEYLVKCINNIQVDYLENNFEQRIKKYVSLLTNSINSIENFKNIYFENSENLIRELIINSINLFNETLWLKLYEFPKKWDLSKKSLLKNTLNIKKEELLLISFDLDKDLENLLNINNNELKEKMRIYSETLNQEIYDYQNKLEQYQKELEDITNSLIDEDELKNSIEKLKNIIKEKMDMKNNYDSYTEVLNNNINYENKNLIQKIFTKYKEKKLIKATNINWNEYKKMVYELDSNYLKILKLLNNKINNVPVISNFLINIIKHNIEHEFNIIHDYFELIYDNIFADYWDLDRYENSEYNSLNKNILEILQTNIISIITNELFNTLINYFIEQNIYGENIKNKIDYIKSKPIGSNTIIDYIRTYLYLSMITKLELKNPEKSSYINLDNQKKLIIGEINSIVNNQLQNNHQLELENIIDFNKFLCENISWNCYEEILKILYDCKKMSIYYKMFKLVKI